MNMKKNKKLNAWCWKWHFIAGLISLPFVIMLSITGIIYLFKADYETPKQQHIRVVTPNGTPLSMQQQWEIAQAHSTKKLDAVILPTDSTHATEFVAGRFSHKNSIFVNPYTGTITGTIIPQQSTMHSVRKLHGELLLGKFGTKIIELIASWMVVLIITGIYIWWPARGWQLQGFFIPRIQLGKRTFFRDLHAIAGFWISIALVMTLAGGFPWTDVVGANFKWLQKVTNTGFPKTWHAHTFQSTPIGKTLTLDQMIAKIAPINMAGEVQLAFPKGSKGVFSLSNTAPAQLDAQQKKHYDAYSGSLLHASTWQDVGILMRGRMWFMAFHQGQFGSWNWILMLCIAIILAIMSIAAILSYLLRKRSNTWDVPKVPDSFSVGYGIIIALGILSILFPLFGLSLVFIIISTYLKNRTKNPIPE